MRAGGACRRARRGVCRPRCPGRFGARRARSAHDPGERQQGWIRHRDRSREPRPVHTVARLADRGLLPAASTFRRCAISSSSWSTDAASSARRTPPRRSSRASRGVPAAGVVDRRGAAGGAAGRGRVPVRRRVRL